MTILMMLKKPSGYLPVAMSLTALGVVFVHIALFGVRREGDEGAAAHIWQLLMAGQVPIIGFFVIRWLPQTPGRALPVLGVQIAAALAAMAPVWMLRL